MKAQLRKDSVPNKERDPDRADSSYLLKKTKLTDLAQLTQIYHSPIILAVDSKKRNIQKKEVAKAQ